VNYNCWKDEEQADIWTSSSYNQLLELDSLHTSRSQYNPTEKNNVAPKKQIKVWK